MAAWMNGKHPVNKIDIFSRMNGALPTAFPQLYTVYLTSESNSSWIKVGTFSTQPTSNKVTISLDQIYQTYGVHIVPNNPGQDSNGNYYFQLAEVQLRLG